MISSNSGCEKVIWRFFYLRSKTDEHFIGIHLSDSIFKRLGSGANAKQVRFDFYLRLPKSSLMCIDTLKQLFCTADFRSPVKDFFNLGVIDILHVIDFH